MSRVNVTVWVGDKFYHKSLPTHVPVLQVAGGLAESLMLGDTAGGVPVLRRASGEVLSGDSTLGLANVCHNEVLVLSVEPHGLPFLSVVEDVSVPIGELRAGLYAKLLPRDVRIVFLLLFAGVVVLLSVVGHVWWWASGYSVEVLVFNCLLTLGVVLASAVLVLFRTVKPQGVLGLCLVWLLCLLSIKYQEAGFSWEQGLVFCAALLAGLTVWLLVYRRFFLPVLTVLVLGFLAGLVCFGEATWGWGLRNVWVVLLTVALLFPCLGFYDPIVAGVKAPRLVNTTTVAGGGKSRGADRFVIDPTYMEDCVYSLTRRVVGIDRVTLVVSSLVLVTSCLGLLCTAHQTVTNVAVCLVAVWCAARFSVTHTRFNAVWCIIVGVVLLMVQLLLIAYTQPGARFTATVLLVCLPFLLGVVFSFGLWISGKDLPRVLSVLVLIQYGLMLAIIPCLLLSVNMFRTVRTL